MTLLHLATGCADVACALVNDFGFEVARVAAHLLDDLQSTGHIDRSREERRQG